MGRSDVQEAVWRRSETRPPPREELSYFGDQIVLVPSRDLMGQFSRSPNGRYMLVWSDADQAGGRGGFRESGEGRYLLLDDGQVIVEGGLQRLNDGKVADNGVFLLNDWLFSQSLHGKVCAFAADGRPLLAHPVAANLYNNGLSADGGFAAVHTCNAPTDDANRLMVFDLGTGVLAAKFTPEIGWADHYAFSGPDRIVRLGLRDGGQFAYSFDGVFVDRAAWLDHGLATGQLMVLEALVRDAGGRIDAALAVRMAPGLERALAQPNLHSSSRARLLRYRAEGHEAQGEAKAALAVYEEALLADPKLGVKRKISQLRKQLAD